MSKKYVLIEEAAYASKKSAQTIRRAIKAGKLAYERQETPQGFIYQIDRESLIKLYKIKEKTIAERPHSIIPKNNSENVTIQKDAQYITKNDFQNLTELLERMLSEHSDERQNFLRLLNTMQEKIFTLENQINVLHTPAKKWYELWK